jgi:hypothetical protein
VVEPSDHSWLRATGGTVAGFRFPNIPVCSNQLLSDLRTRAAVKHFGSLLLLLLLSPADHAQLIHFLTDDSCGPLFLCMLGGCAVFDDLRPGSKRRATSASCLRAGRRDGSAPAGLPCGTVPRFRGTAEFNSSRLRMRPGSAPRRCPFGYST